MYTDEDAKLIPQFKYNLGEFYAPIDIYTDEEVQEIYFFHEHIPLQEIGYDKFKTRIEYFHRINHGN